MILFKIEHFKFWKDEGCQQNLGTVYFPFSMLNNSKNIDLSKIKLKFSIYVLFSMLKLPECEVQGNLQNAKYKDFQVQV